MNENIINCVRFFKCLPLKKIRSRQIYEILGSLGDQGEQIDP